MPDAIHARYQELAEQVKAMAPKGPVLKTDGWQEENNFNPIPADYYIETRREAVELVKAFGYKAEVGDIRDMAAFEDGKFAALIDTSTIDHVPDYAKALDEYRRVLKPGGAILVVVFLTTDRSHYTQLILRYLGDGILNRNYLQFYFNDAEFRREMDARFEIEQVINLEHKREKGYLVAFIGKKKEA